MTHFSIAICTLIFFKNNSSLSLAVAGFFGMNLISGLESAEGMFEMVVLSSCLFGGGFMGACVSFLEGSKTRAKTIENLNQIEVLNRALSDMPAVSSTLFNLS